MKVCIVGLGFVGAPMADLCSRKGHETTGVDIDEEKVAAVNKGVDLSTGKEISQTIKATTEYSAVAEAEVVVLCVPTPIGEDRRPDLSILTTVAGALAPHIRKGQLCILESTVNPGVTEELLIPKLEGQELQCGKDFDVAYCPERIDQGNTTWTIENLPRVLGATSPEAMERARAFYATILTAEVSPTSSIKAAEAVKVFENTFRDVNIALVNELAKAFDKIGIDFYEIVRGAATKPFGFMPFYPSAGVGGTCIPMSASYLAEWAEGAGATVGLIRAAREINDGMPAYTARLVLEEMKGAGLDPSQDAIGILGLAYKGGLPDTRDSPALLVRKHLESGGARVHVFDPYLPKESTVKSGEELLQCPCVVLLTDHPEFKELDFSGVKVLIDGKNFLDKEQLRSQGVRYHGIGRP